MKLPVSRLVNGAVWTIGAYGTSQVLRLATNVILTRLLAPELFGLMLIVNTLGTGIQLISDIGIGQNIIHSKNAYRPSYYNTAWSLQIIRSLAIWLVFMVAVVPISRFYDLNNLVAILSVSSIGIIFGGFTSVSPLILQKRMEFAKVNLFWLFNSVLVAIVFPALAYFNRTIWSLVFGGLAVSTASMVASYFLIPDMELKFRIERRYVWEIVNFGKWVFISSMVYFLAGNFDRLYFAKAVPLSLLGIYGIARSISDMLAAVATHLGNNVVFPFISSHADKPRQSLRQELVAVRANFLLLTACGFSLLIATADLAIKLLYDERYRAAGWMLPVLVIGAWFSMIATINESTLLGLGKPSYSAFTNGLRFVLLIVWLPVSVKLSGLVGGIVTLVIVEVCRYAPVLVGQRRERFSFAGQDLSITFAMLLMTGFWEWLRWAFGFGTSFDSLIQYVSQ